MTILSITYDLQSRAFHGNRQATIEGEIAINAMRRRRPNLALDADLDALEWSEGMILHGLKALPVRV